MRQFPQHKINITIFQEKNMTENKNDNKEDKKEDKTDALSLIKIIPQVFFDIIAYIIPGIFSLTIISITLLDFEKTKKIAKFLCNLESESAIPGILIFGIGLIFSYIFGVTSSSVVGIINKIPYFKRKEEERNEKYRKVKHYYPNYGQ